MVKRVFCLAVLVAATCLGSATAGSVNVNDGDKDYFECEYRGARTTGDRKMPCKGRTIRVCGIVKYTELTSTVFNGMISYECERKTYDADGTLVHLEYQTLTVPENTLFRDAAFDIETQVAESYGMQCAGDMPSTPDDDFMIHN